MKEIKKIYFFLFLVIVLIKFLFLPFFGDFYDLFLHSQWANFLIKNPINEIYSKTNCNLPPFWVYILWLFSKIHFLITNKIVFVYSEVLKIPAILFDIFTGLLIFYFLIKEKIEEKKVFLASLFFLLNPFVFYLSSFWGQLDSIYVFFILLSFIFLYYKKTIFASIFLALSFLTKLQGIIFFPLFFFILFKNYPFKKTIFSLLTILLVIFIILLPFLIKGYSPVFIFQKTWIASWRFANFLSLNAFNLWWIPQIIFSFLEPPYIYDYLPLFGSINFKMISLILFSLFYLLIILNIRKNIFFLASLVSFLFFMIPTAMHERYIFPFFAFFSIFWPIKRGYLKYYFYLSLTSFLNLLAVLPPTFLFEETQKIFSLFIGQLSIPLTLINIFIFFYFFFILFKI